MMMYYIYNGNAIIKAVTQIKGLSRPEGVNVCFLTIALEVMPNACIFPIVSPFSSRNFHWLYQQSQGYPGQQTAATHNY